MRLITGKKIYRAFPELDEFSDARCGLLMTRLTSGGLYWPLLLLVSAVMVVMGILVTVILGLLVADGVERLIRQALGGSVGELLYIGVCLAWYITPMFLLPLLVRDVVLGRYLHRALHRYIELTRCRVCGYMLLGQEVHDGLVRCPECGTQTTLRALGLSSPDELIPPDEDTINDRLSRFMPGEGGSGFTEKHSPPEPRVGVETIRRLRDVRAQMQSGLDNVSWEQDEAP